MDATWIVGIIAFVGVTIFICWKTGHVGLEKYDMRLVMNWTFALAAAAAASLIASLFAAGGNSDNATVFLVAGLAAIAGGGYLNIQRSTIGFGLWFTFVQFITASSIVVAVIYFVARRKAVDGSMGVLR